MTGPLAGIRIVEAGGIGPGPFAAMVLADLGAEVLRVDTPRNVADGRFSPTSDPLYRNRRSVGIDLKRPEGLQVLLDLIAQADGLIEGFRPGVAERLGFGPEVCAEMNARLVYGRMTGYGQDGPMSGAPGHDINYIALSGVLGHMPTVGGRPMPPLNLVGDFGGGGLLLALGMACAFVESGRSGVGQVVDAAMVDGSALLMTLFYGIVASGEWKDAHGTNNLEGHGPSYGTYETADHRFMAVGALEPQFWNELLDRLGLSELQKHDRSDPANWPELRERLAAVFRTRTRDEWTRDLEQTDACVSPVLDMHDARLHPHNRHRHTFVEVDGVVQPAPAPRFSRTPADLPSPAPRPGQHSREALVAWDLDAGRVDELLASGVVHGSDAD